MSARRRVQLGARDRETARLQLARDRPHLTGNCRGSERRPGRWNTGATSLGIRNSAYLGVRFLRDLHGRAGREAFGRRYRQPERLPRASSRPS
jgi:hypothetical protein